MTEVQPITSDAAVLLRAILANPEDDAPRLAYADWCDEHPTKPCPICAGTGFDRGPTGAAGCTKCRGALRVPNGNAERAEFIRVQIKLARKEWVPAKGTMGGAGGKVPADVGRYEGLREREHHLWVGKCNIWFTGLGICTALTPASMCNRPAHGFPSRGFLSEIRLTTAAFLGDDRECSACDHGWRDSADGDRDRSVQCRQCNGTGRVGTPGVAAAVFRAHPVTAVRLVDREPTQWAAGRDGEQREWIWERDMNDQPNPEEFTYLGASPYRAVSSGYEAIVPAPIFDGMEGESGMYYFKVGKHGHRRYPTADLARDALSRAVVQYARRLVDPDGRIWPRDCPSKPRE